MHRRLLLRRLLVVALVALAPACSTQLRVMTWNIHHGRGLDGKVDLDRIAAVIRDSGARIVALQEVDVGTQRTDRRNLAQELAERCGMRAVFHKNIDFQGGEYGNAVLTDLPIVDHDNRHYRMLRPHEQRGLLRVQVRFAGRSLQFFNTHIDYRPADDERVSNLAEIHALLDADAGNTPWILCGDFNDTPGSRTHRAATERFIDSWTAVGTGPGRLR
jgi:endonuclease/exonuclease/phosphatase family metal-dependent hydrolase